MEEDCELRGIQQAPAENTFQDWESCPPAAATTGGVVGDQREYLLSHNSKLFVYTAMPFGICTAPYTFTVMTRLCIKEIRQS